MRFSFSLLLGAAFLLGAAIALPAAAQTARPAPSAPPALAPAKPYKTVTVTLPEPMKDASFEAFRKQLAAIAQTKDRAGLARLVAADFFWQGEDGDKADKKKAPIDNLSDALGLGGKEPAGWDLLAGYAGDPTAAPFPDKPNTFCAPADPAFDDKALEDLAKSTQTDPSEWGYPLADGVEVRGAAKADAPVTEKLGLHFVRVMPDETPPAQGAPAMVRVVTPSGKVGYVAVEAIAPLGNDQICYVKSGLDWKIAGFIGGDQ
jgi:hypothetical protein